MKRRNVGSAPRALDATRARKASQAAATGRIAGGGMGVDPSGRVESKLGEGFYKDGEGVWQMLARGLLRLTPGSPKAWTIDPRAVLAASEPTPDDVKGTEPTDANLTATLNRFEQAFQAGDAAILASILPFKCGSATLAGGLCDFICGYDLSSGTYAVFLGKQTNGGAGTGLLYSDPDSWSAKVHIDSTDPIDDSAFWWIVVKLT